MARKRMIDPDIWTSEKFVSLSHGARLLFIGMFSHADDFGRIKVDPVWLKLRIFPADPTSVNEILAWRGEIEHQRGMLQLYEADEGIYGWMPGFKKVQTKLTQFTPKYPPPPDHLGADLHPSEKLELPIKGPLIDQKRTSSGQPLDIKGASSVPNDVDVDVDDDVDGDDEKRKPGPVASSNHPPLAGTSLLSLDESDPTYKDEPVVRWLKAYQRHRPTGSHPLKDLSDAKRTDALMRVEDLIEVHGEKGAQALLDAIFKQKPRPVSVIQAVHFCTKKTENQQKGQPNGATGSRQGFIKYDPNIHGWPEGGGPPAKVCNSEPEHIQSGDAQPVGSTGGVD